MAAIGFAVTVERAATRSKGAMLGSGNGRQVQGDRRWPKAKPAGRKCNGRGVEYGHFHRPGRRGDFQLCRASSLDLRVPCRRLRLLSPRPLRPCALRRARQARRRNPQAACHRILIG
ncbi:hypothetical protein BJA5080_02542 [Bradyrhizobium diazoefficiens SEMIA 5080]|uniref:Uncharacterized protein n=1 Tax=Bradyrhizobium diazoefficiens SEMIA 5080 TaxID=754504 RepID=A0A837C9G8_9BRAD|nr:hypothetical protein BJA5080_02542 [Bradyrhizobium diazoefficiens SEMIA 5080]